MSTPRPELAAFFASEYPGAGIEAMCGDASTRAFWRLYLPDGTTRVVMDYGKPFEGDPDDVVLGTVFRSVRLRVAATERVEPAVGCLVQEDLGDTTLESEIRRRRGIGMPIAPLYRDAVDLAARLAIAGTVALSASDRAAGPALDAERFRFEMDFFLEHFVEGFRRARVTERLRRETRDLAERAATATRRRVLCHRDFHSRNLMVLADGSLAMVDIQDARWGAETYDLASLLRDAYVDLEPAILTDGLARFRAAVAPDDDPERFRARFDLVSLERMVKALGTFGFQATVRGRASYLEGVPRTVGRILGLRERIAGYPEIYALLAGFADRLGDVEALTPGR